MRLWESFHLFIFIFLGDIGPVVQLDRDGLHDLNLQVRAVFLGKKMVGEDFNGPFIFNSLRLNGNKKGGRIGFDIFTSKFWGSFMEKLQL